MFNVLFISHWYPNRYDKMLGLFVQKHAEAVSQFCKVKVLYVHADENIQSIEIIQKIHINIIEIIVYYPAKGNNVLNKIMKYVNYFHAYKEGYKVITSDGFIPDITHANILTRTGFIAYLLKLIKGIPFVITEHWSRYLDNRIGYNGIIRKYITKIVVKSASAILPVSNNLKNAMLAHNLKNSNYIVVNNVVDNYFFDNKTKVLNTKKRIIHVSCFDEASKNIKGILRATYKLSKIRQDFELILIGSGIDFEKAKNYVEILHFPKDVIHFLGEKAPKEVANWMQNSDFFILFSNYENSPVVISESLACGKPVISSNVGGISEHVNNTNGILVESGDENELFKELNYMLDNFLTFNSDKIKEDAKLKFSYENVGNKIVEIYKSIIK